MIISEYDRYQLNKDQFESLFTKNVGDVREETFASLRASAANGNLDCIDMLHNLALREDATGDRAESILFDLFSGKTPGRTGVDTEIQKTSLKLYETACNIKDNSDMEKLSSPSRLLYMAGSAATSITQKQEITDVFTSQSSFEDWDDWDDWDIWSDQRKLTSDELNDAIEYIKKENDNLSYNYPMGLIHPETKENLISEQIDAKIDCEVFQEPVVKPELFVVNTGDHWILLTLYKDSYDEKFRSVVFSSTGLNSDIRDELSKTVKDVAAERILFIEKHMQDDAINGCGVFVAKAIEAIAAHSWQDPATTLNNFAEDFASYSQEERKAFNTYSHRQLYGCCILQRCTRSTGA